MKRFKYECFTSDFHSINDVITHMQAIDRELEGTDLYNLRYFNTTYLIITQTVSNRLDSNIFDDPIRMEQFDILFAKYYFQSLHGYVNNEGIAPAWKSCYDYCQSSVALKTICMALGVNAHVNNDLPQTLEQFHYGDTYKKDYTQINSEIKSQIPQVIKYLNESHRVIAILQKVPKFYYMVLYIIILYWRSNAWNKYKELVLQKTQKNKIESGAHNIALLLIKLMK